MKGSMYLDKFYMWISQLNDQPPACLITREGETKLWHKKLGYLDLRSMRNIIYAKAINVIPNH